MPRQHEAQCMAYAGFCCSCWVSVHCTLVLSIDCSVFRFSLSFLSLESALWIMESALWIMESACRALKISVWCWQAWASVASELTPTAPGERNVSALPDGMHLNPVQGIHRTRMVSTFWKLCEHRPVAGLSGAKSRPSGSNEHVDDSDPLHGNAMCTGGDGFSCLEHATKSCTARVGRG
jgi:hypothetical protein